MTTATIPHTVNPAAITRNGHAEDKPMAQRALLAKLQISNWSEQTVDKAATEEVAQSNNVAPGSGRYTKRLLNKDATQQVRDIGRQARNFHNSLTIPWDDNGTRLLPIQAYDKYTARIDELIEARRDATNQLIRDFYRHVEDARADLGNLFNAAEYPEPEQLRNAFNMSVEFDSVPDGRNFIAQIPDSERQRISQEIENRLTTRINAGIEDIIQRLVKLVRVAHTQMQQADAPESQARIYDSMVTNIREMVENIPLLNITNDARLTKAADQLKTATDNLHADHLRPKSKHYDAAKRDQFKHAVDDMAQQFAGYFA